MEPASPAAASLAPRSAFSAYDERLAAADIYLNQATGCDTAALSNWSCGLACTTVPTVARRVAFNHSSFTMALVARLSPSECVLVFRGTKDIWDVLRDVDFFPKALPDCDGCKVHSGFYNGWASLKSLVVDDLAGLGCGNSSLSITGHSLGAAMAALAAYELLTASGVRSSNSSSMRSSVPFASIRRVYTYGQPRTGNGAFASSFADRMDAHRIPHFRVVDYRDAVPHLPLHDMLAEGWVHTAPEVYYNHTQLRDFTLCARANDTRCSYQWDLIQTLTHTCDHCSYLGLNPCDCGSAKPQCMDPKTRGTARRRGFTHAVALHNMEP